MTAPANLTPAELEALKAKADALPTAYTAVASVVYADGETPKWFAETWATTSDDRIDRAHYLADLLSAAPRLIAMAERLARLEPLLEERADAEVARLAESAADGEFVDTVRVIAAEAALLAALRGAR
jgi:hypothetical protein